MIDWRLHLVTSGHGPATVRAAAAAAAAGAGIVQVRAKHLLAGELLDLVLSVAGAVAEVSQRAVDAARHADLVLHLCPVGEAADPIDAGPDGPPTWIVTTKADTSPDDLPGLAISVRSGAGIDRLVERVRGLASETAGDPEGGIPTRSRHRDAIGMAVGYLRECDVETLPPEVAAELLRMASDALGRIVGKRGVEDLLDVIFSQFCIGK